MRYLNLSSLVLLSTVFCATSCHYEECDAEAYPVPPQSLRNPETGICETYARPNPGSGGTCGDYQGSGHDEALVFIPEWANCNTGCEALGEADCLANPECRGAYVDDSCQDDCPPPPFFECWGIAPTNPASTAGCATYNAEECSRHNECIAVHQGERNGIGPFSFCADEPGAQPDAGTCYGDIVCRALPPECPEGTLPGRKNGCWTGYCIPTNRCEPVPDHGDCYSEVTCERLEPTCPEGTLPGRKDGCWTDYCIPVSECGPPPLSCSALTEAECSNRDDCVGLYEGVDCQCDASGCTCADWLYQSCQDWRAQHQG